jgi:hypothetical protein
MPVKNLLPINFAQIVFDIANIIINDVPTTEYKLAVIKGIIFLSE